MLDSAGCDKSQAKSNHEVKEISAELSTNEVKLRGNFKRSFEVYELEANNIVYYLSDPKQLLINDNNQINQQGYYKYFEICVVGKISSDGSYGPLGKYQKQITVRAICI